MWGRRALLNRLLKYRAQGVPVTNYGLSIACSLGVIDQALTPFPGVLEVFDAERAARTARTP